MLVSGSGISAARARLRAIIFVFNFFELSVNHVVVFLRRVVRAGVSTLLSLLRWAISSSLPETCTRA